MPLKHLTEEPKLTPQWALPPPPRRARARLLGLPLAAPRFEQGGSLSHVRIQEENLGDYFCAGVLEKLYLGLSVGINGRPL